MEASAQPEQTLVMSDDHVVEWQLARTVNTAWYASRGAGSKRRARRLRELVHRSDACGLRTGATDTPQRS